MSTSLNIVLPDNMHNKAIHILESSTDEEMPAWAISAAHKLFLEMAPDEFYIFYSMLVAKVSWYDLEQILNKK